MSPITDIQLQNSTEYYSAIYIGKGGEVYEIVLCRNIEKNIGWEELHLINVQYRGDDIEDEVLWKEIEESLSEISLDESSDEVVQFIIKIEQESLDILDSLIKLVQGGSCSTPEEALEISIFTQIAKQLK